MSEFAAPKSDKDGAKGIAAACAAQAIWGMAVLFWPLFDYLPSMTILAHRMLWSCIFMLLVLLLTRRWGEVKAAVKDRRTFITLCICALLLSSNWLVYLWAVNSGRIVQASLGYYICPLLNVLMGRMLLGERMSRAQGLAVLLCFLGVGIGIVVFGEVPWVSLFLAVSFALYGFLQKTVRVESAPALFLETLVLLPVAIIWLFYAHPGSLGMTGHGVGGVLLLISTFVFTAVPLLLFSFGARHINLSTVGIIQYINPSLSFLIAVFIKHEQIKPGDMITFPIIWLALVIYSLDAVRQMRALQARARQGAAL